jgi:hypothetical protein
MLLVAILAIRSNEGSLVGIERFARRHREVLNALLGTDFGKESSDSTFRLLLSQLDLSGFERWCRQPRRTLTVGVLPISSRQCWRPPA